MHASISMLPACDPDCNRAARQIGAMDRSASALFGEIFGLQRKQHNF